MYVLICKKWKISFPIALAIFSLVAETAYADIVDNCDGALRPALDNFERNDSSPNSTIDKEGFYQFMDLSRKSGSITYSVEGITSITVEGFTTNGTFISRSPDPGGTVIRGYVKENTLSKPYPLRYDPENNNLVGLFDGRYYGMRLSKFSKDMVEMPEAYPGLDELMNYGINLFSSVDGTHFKRLESKMALTPIIHQPIFYQEIHRAAVPPEARYVQVYVNFATHLPDMNGKIAKNKQEDPLDILKVTMQEWIPPEPDPPAPEPDPEPEPPDPKPDPDPEPPPVSKPDPPPQPPPVVKPDPLPEPPKPDPIPTPPPGPDKQDPSGGTQELVGQASKSSGGRRSRNNIPSPQMGGVDKPGREAINAQTVPSPAVANGGAGGSPPETAPAPPAPPPPTENSGAEELPEAPEELVEETGIGEEEKIPLPEIAGGGAQESASPSLITVLALVISGISMIGIIIMGIVVKNLLKLRK